MWRGRRFGEVEKGKGLLDGGKEKVVVVKTGKGQRGCGECESGRRSLGLLRGQ